MKSWIMHSIIAAAPPPPAEQASGEHVASDEAVDSLYSELFCTGKYLRAAVPIDPKEIIRRHLNAALSQRPVVDEEADRLATVMEIALRKLAEPVAYIEQALKEHRALAPQQPEKGETP